MRIKRLVQAVSVTAVTALLMAASASAAPITFNTNATGTGGTGFNSGGILSLNDNGTGQAATLTFVPNPDNAVGVPSNINYGTFTLACATCTDQAGGLGSFFDAFTFELVVTDVTDGAEGIFTGTSSGGALFTNVSQIDIDWAPLQLGTGINNASSGNFGSTSFTISTETLIVPPDSGTDIGETTVQGKLDSAEVPEPATFGLVGIAIVGLGWMQRKRLSRQ